MDKQKVEQWKNEIDWPKGYVYLLYLHKYETSFASLG